MTTLNERGQLGCGPLTERYDEALAYAARHHRDQLRKGSRVPYLSHLMSVSALVLEHGGTEDQAIAALLHDAVEDAPAGEGPAVLADLEQRFGADVAGVVAACSDSTNDGPEGKAPWRERKENYIAGLTAKREDALLVTACDKIHNGSRIAADVRTFGSDFWTTFNAGRDELVWYYRSCGEVLSERLPGTTAALELARVVDDLASNP